MQDEVSVVQNFFLQFSICSLLLFSCGQVYGFNFSFHCAVVRTHTCMFESERYGGHSDVPTSLIPHKATPLKMKMDPSFERKK